MIACGLLFTLLRFVGARQVAQALARAEPLHLSATAALLLVWLCLGGVKIWWLLRGISPVGCSGFLRAYLLSWATGLVLPGQLGDASQVIYLRRQGVPPSASSAAYLVDKIISLSWIVIVACAATAIYFTEFLSRALGLLALVTLLGLVATVLLARRLRGAWIRSAVEALRDLLRHPGALVCNVLLTLLKWLVQGLLYHQAFRTVGLSVDYWSAAILPALASLPAYVPISLGGAGTLEWAGSLLFGSQGHAVASVSAGLVLLRILIFGLAAAAVAVTTLNRSNGPTAHNSPDAD